MDAKRPQLPSLALSGEDGVAHAVYGFADYTELVAAARAAGAQPTGAPAPTVDEALAQFGSMAGAEIAAVCGLPGPRAPAELWRLALDWHVTPERLGSGELWTLA